MKKIFIIILILLIFLSLIIYNYFRQNFTHKKELNAYYPEVTLIEIFKDDLYKSYDINIQGLFYSKNVPRDMPIFIVNKLDNIHNSVIGYDRLYGNELYMNDINLRNYKSNYNIKNQGLELFYFQIKFDIKNNQDLEYKYFLEEIINNGRIKAFRYQKKDIMGGLIYISDPFVINFNNEQINSLKIVYHDIFNYQTLKVPQPQKPTTPMSQTLID